MAKVRDTKSVMLDGTGRRIAEALKGLSMVLAMEDGRILGMNQTDTADGLIVEVIGIPPYISEEELVHYSDYNLTEPGWYAFSRIMAPAGVTVTAETTVEGATGYSADVGDDFVDIAVEFEAAAMSHKVTIDWGSSEESYLFKATDLAIRNLDYLCTFYIYDLAKYATWEYALTADTTFAEGKAYYTQNGGEYVLAEVTAGEAVPENTYYNHSKIVIAGLVRNVTYKLNAVIDCPMEINVPEVADDGHGCWFEMHLRHSGSHSITMVPPEGSDMKAAAAGASAAVTAGFNVVDLHYTEIDGVKMWMLANVHTNIPS